MTWATFKTSKIERELIEEAFYRVAELCRWSEADVKKQIKKFKAEFGPGIPTDAVLGIICKNFIAGMDRRGDPLAQFAIYAPEGLHIMVLGAAYGVDHNGAIAAGCRAYSTAFERSNDWPRQ